MTLDDLLSALRRHRLPAGLAAVLVLLLAGAAAFLPADRYSATASVIAKPVEAADVASYSAAVSVLVPTLAAYVTSDANEALVRGSLPPDLAVADVDVEARAEPGTGLLTITATSTRRDAVARFANSASFALRAKQARDLAGLRLAVLDDAVDPEEPSGPPRTAVLLGGIVLAALVGMSVALVARALATRAEVADVVAARTGLPVIGELPRMRLHRTALQDSADPRLIEALQRIRVALESAGATAAGSTLAITSLYPGEGKSSLSAALADALAVAGQQVVLIDADLRRPTQHLKFDLALTPGLSEAAVLEPMSLLQATDEPTLWLMAAGIPERHPLEVLDAALPAALRETTRSSALVLVDTPPLEAVAETLRALTLTRHTVLVLDSSRIDLQALDRTLTRLRGSGVSVVGIVLNRVRVKRKARKDHYYSVRHDAADAANLAFTDPVPVDDAVPARSRG